jgi:Rps23 Pro-64 3,4-dihydroxylase Tpa1-like proline 4-hydroxylase
MRNIAVYPNVLGEDFARRVLGLIKTGKFVKKLHPLDDRGYSCSYSVSAKLAAHSEVMEAAKRVSKSLWDAECFRLYVYRMDEGDHFKQHIDSGEHGVYYLCEDWVEDWGGVLSTENEKFVPAFDVAATVAARCPHLVTPVTAAAKFPRYTLLLQRR